MTERERQLNHRRQALESKVATLRNRIEAADRQRRKAEAAAKLAADQCNALSAQLIEAERTSAEINAELSALTN
jgi:hypothetical protein